MSYLDGDGRSSEVEESAPEKLCSSPPLNDDYLSQHLVPELCLQGLLLLIPHKDLRSKKYYRYEIHNYALLLQTFVFPI